MLRTTVSPRGLRTRAAAVVLAGSLLLAGCGVSVQTLQSYTPAQGTNADPQKFLKVRNLLIIASAYGAKGRLSGSLASQRDRDALAGITGVAIKADGSEGSALTFSTQSVPLAPGTLVVLTDPPAPRIDVTGADLKPGLTAKLDLTFSSGSTTSLVVPVLSANDPVYRGTVPDLVTPETPRPTLTAGEELPR